MNPLRENSKQLMNEQLVHLCKEGQPAAQRELYDRFANKMFKICFRYLRDKMETEDAVMKGFLKVFQNIHKFEFRGDRSLEAWIKRIIINEALMSLRKRNEFTLFSEKAPEIAAPPLLIDGALDAEYLHQMIAELPSGYRTVFNLYAIEGYTHKEIGTMLQINENTSKSQLSKARARLKQKLEHHEEKR